MVICKYVFDYCVLFVWNKLNEIQISVCMYDVSLYLRGSIYVDM